LASIVSVVGTMYEYFVNRSTTIIIMLCPSDLGSLAMKLIVIYSHSRVGTSVFWSSLYGVCRDGLSR
jgi:hypothetical protein